MASRVYIFFFETSHGILRKWHSEIVWVFHSEYQNIVTALDLNEKDHYLHPFVFNIGKLGV